MSNGTKAESGNGPGFVLYVKIVEEITNFPRFKGAKFVTYLLLFKAYNSRVSLHFISFGLTGFSTSDITPLSLAVCRIFPSFRKTEVLRLVYSLSWVNLMMQLSMGRNVLEWGVGRCRFNHRFQWDHRYGFVFLASSQLGQWDHQ